MTKIPVVLNGEYFMKNLQSPSNIEHMAIIIIDFSDSFRNGEIVEFKSGSIDLGKGLIHIKDSRGQTYGHKNLSQTAKKILKIF